MTTPIAPGLVLQGPVMIASGTFGEDGFGRGATRGELDGLGAAVLKTCTLRPRAGNPEPRLFHGPAGAYLINSVGLENPGLEALLERLPEILSELPGGVLLMASIAGRTPREFGALARTADDAPEVRAIELNLSCPNIEHGQDFCRDGAQAARAVAEAVANTGKPVIAKLAPGAEAPAALARSCEAAGASALTISNTLPAMAYEPGTGRQALGGLAGGMSGPALRPVSLLMVYRASRAVRIPVIGAGGISGGSSAREYLTAGASAVQVGTANLLEPGAARRIDLELREILKEDGRRGE